MTIDISKCPDCVHYWNNPQIPEPICCKGVTYGTHPIPRVACATMRSDGWWGTQACGTDAKFYEAK